MKLFSGELRQDFEKRKGRFTIRANEDHVEDARRKTFDKHGRPKESPLIPIYRVMLYNWITIENMSGPKELANFLTPHLA